MAFLKQWAARAHNDLQLRQPLLTPGGGRALRGDATQLVNNLPHVDLAYLDPPYNQHRYFTNYHVWETLVRWDSPEAYGIAAKRLDSRDDSTKSVFNKTREMPAALADVVKKVDAETLILSFSDEGFVRLPLLIEMCEARGQDVRLLQFDSKRYVGSQIGIYNPSGQRVGQVGRARNLEYVLICGESQTLDRMAGAVSHLEKREPVVEQMKLFV